MAYLKGNTKDNENEICKSLQLLLTGRATGQYCSPDGESPSYRHIIATNEPGIRNGLCQALKALLGWLWLEQMK
jgi:hypothetical protein